VFINARERARALSWPFAMDALYTASERVFVCVRARVRLLSLSLMKSARCSLVLLSNAN
jgi:hypothetical protein